MGPALRASSILRQSAIGAACSAPALDGYDPRWRCAVRAKMITLWTIVALACAGCLVTGADRPPCSPCKMKCEQDLGDGCEDCRAENCPDLEAE